VRFCRTCQARRCYYRLLQQVVNTQVAVDRICLVLLRPQRTFRSGSGLDLPTPIDTNRSQPDSSSANDAFHNARPKACNELPTKLKELTDHSAFRRQLKTFLFERAFSTQWWSCRWSPGCKRWTVCVHRAYDLTTISHSDHLEWLSMSLTNCESFKCDFSYSCAAVDKSSTDAVRRAVSVR